ncbi:MAG: helix-turn-helix domain-containing protein [Armatimonadota bacterium]|nr:helix-turn-helix domain-containing protein [Armatimonadota bacterium]MDR7536087.1 helix-turn-helix domain-containing protein [Armatimonadota bacterium]
MSARTDRPREGRWLPLGQAAALLGVDEATLRHWADMGRVRTFRTPGGHRRFREDDLHALLQREAPKVEDLGHLLRRRSARVLAGAPARPLQRRPWFSALDPALRARAREHGRHLFAAVVQFMAHPEVRRTLRQQLLERAARYGSDLRRAGVGPAEAAEAFAYFRHVVLKMVTDPRGRGGLLDEAQVRTLLETSDLLDAVFTAMLRAQDAAPGHPGRRADQRGATAPPPERH